MNALKLLSGIAKILLEFVSIHVVLEYSAILIYVYQLLYTINCFVSVSYNDFNIGYVCRSYNSRNIVAVSMLINCCCLKKTQVLFSPITCMNYSAYPTKAACLPPSHGSEVQKLILSPIYLEKHVFCSLF